MPTDRTPNTARPTLIAPSILSADFTRLGAEVAEVEAAGADWLHVDVIDGNFAPNLTFGPVVVRALRRVTALPLDVHLMITQPANYLEPFVEAGATTLSFHAEATPHVERTLRQIRALHCRAGLALNPHTPETSLEYVLDELDVVMIMSVNPGFSGQAFLPSQLLKIERLRSMIDRRGLDLEIEVDGGIGPHNARQVVAAGADVIVAGAAIFGMPDLAAAMRALLQALAD